MKYIAVLDTDEIEDFAFFEDGKEQYLHAIDAMADNGEWIYLPFKPLKQEPRKGHWILTDVEGNRVWHCNCSECGKDPIDYIGGSENWWLIKSKLSKYCPNCGADMREVKNDK